MKLLAEGAAQRALDDPKFLQQMPEFSGVQRRAKAVPAQRPGGCTGCMRKRAAKNVLQDFSRTALGLNPEARKRIVAYFGEPVMVRTAGVDGKPIREVLK